MIDLVILVPSRNRPGTARPVADAIAQTSTADAVLAYVVDESDPTGGDYARALGCPVVDVRAAGPADWAGLVERRVGVFRTPSKTMIEALNEAAVAVVDQVRPYAVAFLGDDNRPRTAGWDARFVAELRRLGTGVVYGNDLIQGANLPTQVAMTADIIRELGWMGPPGLTHLYIDNFWYDLGERAGCLRYLPDVVIEHLHPLAGKGPVDEGYRRVNSPAAYRSGEAAYRAYAAASLDADAARVRALRGVRA
jgi:hypothetical protein